MSTAARSSIVLSKMWKRLGAWLLYMFVGIVTIWRLEPPSRDEGGFDTERALVHLHHIAANPHPGGSAENDAVRAYLITQLQTLGYEVQTQPFQAKGRDLTNILAKRPGQDPRAKAVTLVAHYDSVRFGPGAGDDGAAVAALLEVARVFALENHRNPLLILLTDGEEMGLLGAQAFVHHNAAVAEVGVILNFEARGTSGPSIMFQTSRGNRWLIDLYAKNAPHPVSSSLTDDVYQHMPNNTDFTIFREVAKLPGLNFAFIGGVRHYHTKDDSIDNLDRASMRHHGIQALSIARKLLDADLSLARSEEDVVYFDVLGAFMVHYPMRWVWPLTILACALAFAAAVFSSILRSKKSSDSLSRAAPWRRVGVYFQLGFWIALAIVLARFVPGASYLATWPLIAFAISRMVHSHALAIIAGLLAIILMVPPIFLSVLAMKQPLIGLGFVLLALLIAPIRTGSGTARRSQ